MLLQISSSVIVLIVVVNICSCSTGSLVLHFKNMLQQIIKILHLNLYLTQGVAVKAAIMSEEVQAMLPLMIEGKVIKGFGRGKIY